MGQLGIFGAQKQGVGRICSFVISLYHLAHKKRPSTSPVSFIKIQKCVYDRIFMKYTMNGIGTELTDNGLQKSNERQQDRTVPYSVTIFRR